MRHLRAGAAALALVALTAGCGSDSPPVASAPQPTTTAAALVLKPATGKPAVTIVGLANAGQPLAVDVASFEGLPTTTLTIFEPFEKKTMSFTGASVVDVMDAIDASGTSVTLHALDDYEATLDLRSLRAAGAIFATAADGKRLDIKAGGPLRLVFPKASKLGRDTDLWVWSIDRITIS